MQSNPFNNLPKINKRDAINILRTPIGEVKLLADYYKAVFHLANFPCKESEMVLLDFISYDSEQLEYKIAKRKAIELLAIFECKNAIPIIAEFPYIQKIDSNILDILWEELDIRNKLISLLNSKTR